MSQPARVLGCFEATCIVIGAIIGVGIFFTPSNVTRLTGSTELSLIAWSLGGLIALCGALTFAELGSRYHGPGAQYQILRDSMGTFPAFLFVFCNSTAILPGAIGVISVICARNLGVAFGSGPPSGAAASIAGAMLVASLTIANCVGVRWGSRVQILTVVCKIATLVAVACIAAIRPAAEAPVPLAPPGASGGISSIFAALVPAFFSYGGWQHSLWISGEVKNPRRNLPRAIVVGVIVVVAVYLLSNWAYLRLLGVSRVAQSQAIAADAVATLWPDIGRRFIAAAVAFSAFGVLNAQLLSGPRLLYSMATDGRFPERFARLSPTFGTPIMAITLLGALGVLLLALAGPDGIDRLLTGAVFIDGIFFVLTGIALFVLRRKDPPGPQDFRVPLYPFVPLFFVLGEVGVVVGAHLDERTRIAAFFATAWIAASALAFAGLSVAFRRLART